MINEFLPCAELKHNNVGWRKIYEKRLEDIFAGFYSAECDFEQFILRTSSITSLMCSLKLK